MNQYPRRIRAAGLILTLGLALLGAGCGSKERDPEGKSITFWHSMGVGTHRQTIQNITGSFTQTHPELSVTAIYQGSYSDLLQKLIAALTAGTNPSMSQMYETWTSRFFNRGHLVALNSFFASDPSFAEQDLNDFYQVFLDGNTWDGQLLSLPFNKSAYVLYYNADMLREAGYTQPPRTWDEMRDICEKVQKRGLAPYGYAMRSTLESLTTLLYANGGRYLNDEGTKMMLDTPESRETVEFLHNMLFVWKIASVESDYLNNGFGSEKFAMYIGSTAGFPYNDRSVAGRFEWRVAPIPSKDLSRPRRTLFQGTNIGIFSNTTEQERLHAWQYLRHLTNTDNATQWAIQTGYLPIRKSCLNHPDMKAYLEKNPNYKAVLPELENGVFEPRIEQWESMRNVLTREFDSFLNGRKGVEEFIRDSTQKCEYVLEAE
ncbi:MAG: ABC transporter substrate-binding protein [Candidatus Sumerlaeia bacterium]